MEFEVGKMYRAISNTEVIELDTTHQPGLKLLVEPRRIKHLKFLQKALEKRAGYRPDLKDVLNLWLEAMEERFFQFNQEQVLSDLHERLLKLQSKRDSDLY